MPQCGLTEAEVVQVADYLEGMDDSIEEALAALYIGEKIEKKLGDVDIAKLSEELFDYVRWCPSCEFWHTPSTMKDGKCEGCWEKEEDANGTAEI